MLKGFTLVELAVVLVIIGLIMGMAVKGKSLIDTAKVRSDITKLSKIESALHVYYAKHGKMPGSSSSIKYIPEQSGLNILDSDLIIKSGKEGCYFGLIYAFSNPHNNFITQVTSQYLYMNNLIIVSSSSSKNFTDSNSAIFPGNLACSIEIILDDQNHNKGDARGDYAYTIDYDDCGKSENKVRFGWLAAERN